MNKKLIFLNLLLCAVDFRIESSAATVMGNGKWWDGKIPACVLREHGMSVRDAALTENVASPIVQPAASYAENSISRITHDSRLVSACLSDVKPTITKNYSEKSKKESAFAGSDRKNEVKKFVLVKRPTSSISTAARVAGPVAMLCGGIVALDRYVSYKEQKAELERLAKRSYFEKTYDSISGFAKSAKMHTWDSNYGFNHSGKVATVAGLATIAGLSYLAYKKNLLSKRA